MELMATEEDMKNPKIRNLLIPVYIPPSDMADITSTYEITLPNTFCCSCGKITENNSIACRDCFKSNTKNFIPIMMKLNDYRKHFSQKHPPHIEQYYCHYCGTLRRIGHVNERDTDHPILHLLLTHVE